MEGWWPSRWVPLCEQSERGRQRQEEAPCRQLREPWYVSRTEMEAWGSWLRQVELAWWQQWALCPTGGFTLAGSSAGQHGGADELREAAV